MIKEIREFFGFSQSLLSTFLGVSRSQLSMAERGERELKSVVMQRLQKLIDAKESWKEKPSMSVESMTANKKKEINKVLEQKWSENAAGIRMLSQKVDKIINERNRAINVLSCLENVKTDLTRREKNALDVLKDDAKMRLSSEQDNALLNLELDLARLKGEKEFLEKRKR